MSSTADGTWGGRVAGETTSDYNMYFRMTGGTNRGFVFRAGAAGTTNVAGIDASGNGYFTGGVYAASINSNSINSGGFEVGYRKVPLTSVTGVTADASIVGRGYLATSTVTVPANVFSAGDIFSVINNSASNISISQGTGLTMRLVGTATTGSRTLAQRGIATIMFVSATECIVTGVT